MNSKNWLSLNYFLQFAVQGVFFQYWLIYLTNVKDLSVIYASTILSMVYIGRFTGSVFFVKWLFTKFSIKKAYKILAATGFVSSLFYLFTNDVITLSIVTFLVGFTFFNLAPLTETTASMFIKKENLDYGKVRVYGSFSFMLIGTLVGTVLAYVSNNFVYYSLIFLLFIYLIFIYLPFSDILDNYNMISNEKKVSLKWLAYDRNAVLLLSTFFLLQLSHAAYNNYSVLYIESLNISAKWLTGFIVNISILAEIAFFALSSRIPTRLRANKLLMLVCLVATLRWAMLAIYPNVIVFTLTQFLHAITFALAQLTFILLLNKNFPSSKISDMQNLYSAIGFQLSAFIGMYIVGAIWDFNRELVFIVSSVIAFGAFLLSRLVRFK